MTRINKRIKKIWKLYNYSLFGPEFSKKIKLDRLELRLTQVKIVNFILRNFNVGIVFATSLGKTIINILLIDAIWHLDEVFKRGKSRFLILVPTIDLANQFAEDLRFFRKFKKGEIAVLANLNAKKRQTLFNSGTKIFVSTPQGIKNDILNKKILPNFFQYLILDEAHHGRGRYAYTTIAKELKPYAKILGQTATAGDEDKRQEIAEEIGLCGWWRLRIEEELSWLNPILRLEVNIPLNEKENADWLEVEKDIIGTYKITKKELLKIFEQHYEQLTQLEIKNRDLPQKAAEQYLKKNKKSLPKNLQSAGKVKKILTRNNDILSFRDEELIKNYILSNTTGQKRNKMLSYWKSLRQIKEILSRIFQEGYASAFDYYYSLQKETNYSSKRVCKNLQRCFRRLQYMREKKILHPKLIEIQKILKNHPQEQVIIFLNHVKPLLALSRSLKFLGFDNNILIGRANRKLQSEKEAKKIIKDFRERKIKILLVSPVGFEGRHFPHINVGIAVNMFISPEQLLQAMGRLGRTKIDDVMYFLIFGRYDQAIYYNNLRKTKKLFSNLPIIPEEYTPLDPGLETCNLPRGKKDFWAKNLVREKRLMVRERFLVIDVRQHERFVYFALKDKTGFANAILNIDKNTDKELVNFYLSLKNKICIVSGKLIIEKFYISEEISVATIDMTPYPDRQNIAPAPYNSYDLKDYK